MQQGLLSRLTTAAETGDADAQCCLGDVYHDGRKYPEAAKWYRRAALQGHRTAQFKLGTIHDLGKGVEKNREEAKHWYTKATEGGDFWQASFQDAQRQAELLRKLR